VATHHGHLPALGDGAAAAAHACLVPARPVHLLTSSLLPPVEEGLVHQEAAPQRGLQELGALWRKAEEAALETGHREGISSPDGGSAGCGFRDARQANSPVHLGLREQDLMWGPLSVSPQDADLPGSKSWSS
jgi:hypothetical protein